LLELAYEANAETEQLIATVFTELFHPADPAPDKQ